MRNGGLSDTMIAENARRFKVGKKKKPSGDRGLEPNGDVSVFGQNYALVDARFDKDEEYIDHLKDQIMRNGSL